MANDVFRPRLPLDPFHDALPPWDARADSAVAEPHTVLVLGPPTHADLAPLALSPHLASSLLVIATHTPPPVPDGATCAVVILRLPAPLDIHDGGAVRLVGLLDRAQRVAHAWHAAPNGQPRIQQLAELYPGGDFSIAEPPEFAFEHPPQRQPANDSETSSLSSTSSTSCYPPPKSHAQYTFSALINFLPPTLPDKALLKHAILVTTLSAPFLAPQPPVLPLSLTPPRSRFVSLFSKHPPPSPYSSRAPSAESLLPRHAHIVHVLPYSAPRSIPALANPKLAQSIEQFLLSFAYPPSPSASAPSLASLSSLSSSPPVPSSSSSPPGHAPVRSSPLASPSPSIRSNSNSTSKRQSGVPLNANLNLSPNQPAIPFLVPAGLLGQYPDTSTRCVGEMVLCGVLDCVAAGEGALGVEGPRAWIGGRGEVFVREREGSVSPLPLKGKEREEEEQEKKEKEKEMEMEKTKRRRRARARRNEAGLPTPPESSSSSESDYESTRRGSVDTDTHTQEEGEGEAEAEAEAEAESESSFVGRMRMGMKMKSSEFLSGLSREREERRTQSEAHFATGNGNVGGRSHSVLGIRSVGVGWRKLSLGLKGRKMNRFFGRLGFGRSGEGV